MRNLQKKDHGNEFKGSKNGGKELWGGLKWPKMAGKVKNSSVITVAAAAAAAASPARSRRVWRRLAVKFGRRDRLEVVHLHGWRVLQCGGQWYLFWSNIPRLANSQNDPTRVHKFWRNSLGFWSSKGVLGARVSFGIQSYVYIGPGVAFR